MAEEVPIDFWNDARAALNQIKPVFMLAEGQRPEFHEKAFEMIKKNNALEHRALELKEERDKLLLDKFSAIKILKMHHAEYRFNREMVYKMKKKQNDSTSN